MLEPEFAEILASAAHDVWRARMTKAGWMPGERFDPAQQTHPSVRPYRSLPAYRRWQLVHLIEQVFDIEDLVEVVETVLEEPEWTTADVRAGMRVRLAGDMAPGNIGVIESWDIADGSCGALSVIRVRWPDGNVVEYVPRERELEAVEKR